MDRTRIVPGYYYLFGELKAGDKFTHQGREYEKISGNTAVDNKNQCVEIPNVEVFLFELG